MCFLGVAATDGDAAENILYTYATPHPCLQLVIQSVVVAVSMDGVYV